MRKIRFQRYKLIMNFLRKVVLSKEILLNKQFRDLIAKYTALLRENSTLREIINGLKQGQDTADRNDPNSSILKNDQNHENLVKEISNLHFLLEKEQKIVEIYENKFKTAEGSLNE